MSSTVRTRRPVANERWARSLVSQRSDNICEAFVPDVCLGQASTVHHRRKRSHGGLWLPANLLAVCGDGTRGCHGWIESHPKLARAAGLWLFTGDGEPDQRKAWLRTYNEAKSWVLLDNEGGRSWS
jgi:hypothetical protein